MNSNHQCIHIPPTDSQECTLGFYLWSLDPRLMLADSSHILTVLLHQPDNMKRIKHENCLCLVANVSQMRVFPVIVKKFCFLVSVM